MMYRIILPYGWIWTRSVEQVVSNLKRCFPGMVITVTESRKEGWPPR